MNASVELLPEPTSAINHWWRVLPGLIFALGLIVILHLRMLADIGLHWWNTSDYQHGLVIFVVCLYLAWSKRGRIAEIQPRFSMLGLAACGAASLLWLLSAIAGVQITQQVSLVFMIFGTVWALTGWQVARLLAFPIGYILVVIPIWDLLIPVLQVTTAKMSTQMLQAIGVPVFLDGFHMSIPNGSFVVADICAGMRFLLASLAIGALYSHQNFHSVWRAGAFLLFAIIVAVVFNWLRVTAIVTAGYKFGMLHWTVSEHLYVGWFMFALALLPMLAVGELIARGEPAEAEWNDSKRSRSLAGGPPQGLLPLSMLLGVLGLGPAWAYYDSQRDVQHSVAFQPLLELEGWRSLTAEQVPPLDWAPVVIGADAEAMEAFSRDAVVLRLFRAYFARQRQGAELISDSHSFVDTAYWGKPKALRTIPSQIQGVPLVTEFNLVSRRGEKRLIWRIDRVNGVVVGNPYAAKIREVLGRLQGQSSAQLVAIACDYTGDPDEAREQMGRFLAQAWKQLGAPGPDAQ